MTTEDEQSKIRATIDAHIKTAPANLSEADISFLTSQYEEHTEHGRHSETERSTVTNIVGAAGAAIFVYMGSKEFHSEYWWAALSMTGLGLYGFVMTYVLYTRFQKHMAFAYGFRYMLEQRLPATGVREIHQKVATLYPKGMPLHYLWSGLNLLIAMVGVVLALWVRDYGGR